MSILYLWDYLRQLSPNPATLHQNFEVRIKENPVTPVSTISVLLVDDHTVVRKGLWYLLEATDDIRVVAAASNGVEAVAQASVYCPDIAIVDIAMPLMDGIETTRQIHSCCPSTRVSMLSIYANPEYVKRAVEVGASGYVLKEKIGDDLLKAIRTLYKGGRYFSQNIAEIAEKYLDQNQLWTEGDHQELAD